MLPNKMTPAVSSSLIRWVLWASRHHHASRTEGLAGGWSSAGLAIKLYVFFFCFFCCLCVDSRLTLVQEEFPGQKKKLCGYRNVRFDCALHCIAILSEPVHWKNARTGGKRVFVSRPVRILDFSSKKLVMTILLWHIGNHWSIPVFNERFIYFGGTDLHQK